MTGRILLVQENAGVGGSAISGLLLAHGLREAGWDVHVVFGHEGPIMERFRTASYKTRVVPHNNWIRTDRPLYFCKTVFREVQAARGFDEVLAQVRPDLVYLNTSTSLAGALAAHRHGIPCIWHLRELFADVGGEMRAPRGGKGLVRASFRRYASRLVVNSEAVAANMLGASSQTVDVVPNAVGLPFFEYEGSPETARQHFGLPMEGMVVGIPGTLRPMKGHPFFFRAFQQIAADWPDLTVAVAGSGEPGYTRELKTMTQDLGIASMIRFLGCIEHMPAFYRACDAVCVPSVAEPFGRIVIEAFAVGTPVVASAVGGIKEIIDDGETGLLVPYGDTQRLTEALQRVLHDPALRESLRSKALREAEKKYHASVYTARIGQIVAETCGTQPEAAGAVTA